VSDWIWKTNYRWQLTEYMRLRKSAPTVFPACRWRQFELLAIAGPYGTGGNRSSMAVDISSGRKSEIDFVNGVIVRLGSIHGVPTPVNQTLVALIKGLEHNCA